MPNNGSVNQIESSDFTTMSFGAFSRLPSKLSASTVILPSFSVRVMRRVTECSQVTRRPWRSLAIPGVAVGVVGVVPVYRRLCGFLVELHDPVVGNVGKQQVAAFGEIGRPFRPAH